MNRYAITCDTVYAYPGEELAEKRNRETESVVDDLDDAALAEQVRRVDDSTVR